MSYLFWVPFWWTELTHYSHSHSCSLLTCTFPCSPSSCSFSYLLPCYLLSNFYVRQGDSERDCHFFSERNDSGQRQWACARRLFYIPTAVSITGLSSARETAGMSVHVCAYIIMFSFTWTKFGNLFHWCMLATLATRTLTIYLNTRWFTLALHKILEVYYSDVITKLTVLINCKNLVKICVVVIIWSGYSLRSNIVNVKTRSEQRKIWILDKICVWGTGVMRHLAHETIRDTIFGSWDRDKTIFWHYF